MCSKIFSLFWNYLGKACFGEIFKVVLKKQFFWNQWNFMFCVCVFQIGGCPIFWQKKKFESRCKIQLFRKPTIFSILNKNCSEVCLMAPTLFSGHCSRFDLLIVFKSGLAKCSPYPPHARKVLLTPPSVTFAENFLLKLGRSRRV